MYTLSELSNDGQMFTEKQLIGKASELLEASQKTVVMTMDGDMLRKKELTATSFIHGSWMRGKTP